MLTKLEREIFFLLAKYGSLSDGSLPDVDGIDAVLCRLKSLGLIERGVQRSTQDSISALSVKGYELLHDLLLDLKGKA